MHSYVHFLDIQMTQKLTWSMRWMNPKSSSKSLVRTKIDPTTSASTVNNLL